MATARDLHTKGQNFEPRVRSSRIRLSVPESPGQTVRETNVYSTAGRELSGIPWAWYREGFICFRAQAGESRAGVTRPQVTVHSQHPNLRVDKRTL